MPFVEPQPFDITVEYKHDVLAPSIFYGIWINVNLGALTRRSVHPASPALLTKDGPLRGQTFSTEVQLSKPPSLYQFEV